MCAARFDPSLSGISTPYGLGYTGLFQMLAAWREQAWRNAEALTNAPDAASRALVAQQIESTAANEAQAIVATNSYSLVSTSASRDAFCAANKGAAAPQTYAFGSPSPW